MIEIEDLKRVRVEPGDIFVLEVDEPLTRAVAHELAERWREAVGPDAPLIIVPKGLTLYRRAVDDGSA
ncbi:hypothetical protein [Streptomyces roseochromogenus]|uniref:Uncharacterized protein n=1 Tax=Streptomyces roseochromogenus subsp. oscitans DS 12.976 TaxID=1352936 RepID=V6JX24_STRRC|nr:hypothetical protein [Streptomyces roseochromogenus]EST24377.1 hypothetical protein M878_30655 [Streptomyces roseochromogenus subsp. oscitans DS 12.976]